MKRSNNIHMKPGARPNGQHRSHPSVAQRRSLDSQSDDRIFEFLRSLQAEQYFPAFRREEVRFEDLHLLTRGDLKDMGVPIGPARRILAAAGSEASPREAVYPETIETDVCEQFEESKEAETNQSEDFFSQALKTLSKEQQGMLKMMQDMQTAISELRQTPVVSEPDLSPSPLHLNDQSVSFDRTRSSVTSMRRDAPQDISLRLRSHTLSSLAKQRRLPNKYMRVSNLRMSYLLRSQLSAKGEEA